MPWDVFAVIAEPNRRRILDRLRLGECSVGDLVDELEASQPAVSKHLKVLREAGFVSCRVVSQRRMYRLQSAPLQTIDTWFAPYRRMWEHHLDALERHLDDQEDHS